MFIPFFFFCVAWATPAGLLADYGNFSAGDFQAHQAAIVVEHQEDFEIAGGYPQSFITFAVVRR